MMPHAGAAPRAAPFTSNLHVSNDRRRTKPGCPVGAVRRTADRGVRWRRCNIVLVGGEAGMRRGWDSHHRSDGAGDVRLASKHARLHVV